MGKYREIELTGKYGIDKVMLVSEEDYEWVSQYKWYVTKNGYATTFQDGKIQTLHRLICNTPKGMVTDHINNNRLDNRRENLRIVTHKQNSHNSQKPSPEKTSSRYKGVQYFKAEGVWIANIMVDGKSVRIGSFQTEELAAKAYNIKAKELRGEYAYLNDIDHTEFDIEKFNQMRYTRRNKRKEGGTSKFIGVIHKNGVWRSEVMFNGKKETVGTFNTEIEAAQAYNNRIIEIYGEFADAMLNDVPTGVPIPRKRPPRTANYKGVTSRPGGKKFRARIRYNGQIISLGDFNTEEEAAIAYNQKAIELYGEGYKHINKIT